jgi:hypothetical protein
MSNCSAFVDYYTTIVFEVLDKRSSCVIHPYVIKLEALKSKE